MSLCRNKASNTSVVSRLSVRVLIRSFFFFFFSSVSGEMAMWTFWTNLLFIMDKLARQFTWKQWKTESHFLSELGASIVLARQACDLYVTHVLIIFVHEVCCFQPNLQAASWPKSGATCGAWCDLLPTKAVERPSTWFVSLSCRGDFVNSLPSHVLSCLPSLFRPRSK